MMKAARGKALPAIGGIVLATVAGGLACDPSAPGPGPGAADAGVDRIILMAASGGASCVGPSGAGGTPGMPSMTVGTAGGSGVAGGSAGSAGSGGRGGMPASATGGRAGTGGTAGGVGHGGVVASAAGGTGGVAAGGHAGGSTVAAGTGGVGAGTGGSAGGAVAQGSGGATGGSGAAGAGGISAAGGAGGETGSAGAGGSGILVPPPVAGDLAITELLINPAGTDTGREWLEVVNRAGRALDLASLHVADAVNDAAVDFTVSGTTILLPGARAVLIQSADPTKNGGVVLGLGSGIFGGSFGTRVSLNNDADSISVCSGACAAGAVIHQFAWDASLGADYDDHALSIDDGGRRCPAPTPFGDAGSFGTPGMENPPCP